MKQVLLSILALSSIIFMGNNNATAQQAEGTSYQAVIRNSGSVVASTNVNMKFTVIRDSAAGTAVYSETQLIMTSSLGVVNAIVGQGAASLGTWMGIAWNTGRHYLNVQVDITSGTSFTDLGTTQFGAVPFAKEANGLTLFNSGTVNPTKMVISHSGPYPTWGMQYNDTLDAFENVAGGTKTSSISLGTGNITTFNPYGSSGYGDISAGGNIITSNKVKRGTDTTNMLPIAWGTFNSTGVLQVSSGNVSLSSHVTGTYTISIAGETIHYSTHAFIATLQSAPGFVIATSSGGNLYVATYSIAGVLTDNWFSFIIYKK